MIDLLKEQVFQNNMLRNIFLNEPIPDSQRWEVETTTGSIYTQSSAIMDQLTDIRTQLHREKEDRQQQINSSFQDVSICILV